MKYYNKLWFRITAAMAIGFLLAGSSTNITSNCAPVDGAVGCTAYEHAVMRPAELLANVQNSLTIFSLIFLISALIIFALLSAISFSQNKRS